MISYWLQLCHGENKLIFNEMMMRSALFIYFIHLFIYLLLLNTNNIPAMSWHEQIELRFVLDHHSQLDFYSATSLKQRFADKHVHS
jgi:positive regulator of sigma E activity